jgi:two-component system cell cycle response regulator
METNTSIRDELTGLYNYEFFHEKIKNEMERSNRYGKPYSIVRFDIDNFKDINENFGFDFGNLILKQVAQMCSSTTRGSDVVARQNAEEFVVMLPEVSLDDAFVFAERMRNMIESGENFGDSSNNIRLTVSMGIVTYVRKEGMDITQMIQLLDTAVYQAKQNGRNCIVPYTSFMPEEDFI